VQLVMRECTDIIQVIKCFVLLSNIFVILCFFCFILLYCIIYNFYFNFLHFYFFPCSFTYSFIYVCLLFSRTYRTHEPCSRKTEINILTMIY
jgi:hypothetical protein